MNLSDFLAFATLHIQIFFSVQAKGDDNQSVAAMLIREVEKYKLSSRECSWLTGTL
jgi:hypothetical protein